MFQVRKKTREKRDEIESITQETLSISGIQLIKSFAREGYEKARFYDTVTNLMKLEIDLAMVGRWFLASVTAMIVIGPALVWMGGGWLAITAGLQVGVIVAFVSFIQGRSTDRPRRWPESKCRSSARWPSSSASSTTST